MSKQVLEAPWVNEAVAADWWDDFLNTPTVHQEVILTEEEMEEREWQYAKEQEELEILFALDESIDKNELYRK